MDLENKYSYQDCWNYGISLLNQNIANENIKNDLISLCCVSSEKFWLNFFDKFLNFNDYLLICDKLDKYLKKNYPVPYLTNNVSFYNLNFYVEKGIFIPQKDTEILIEKTLQISEEYWDKEKKLKVLDIGTGCGNIVVSLAKNKSNWIFTAVDINKKALKISKKNALNQQLKNIRFIQSDLFSNIDINEKFDIIVSNPPYISNEEYQNLSVTARKQPKEALLADNEGFFFYQEIIRQSQFFLNKKFLIILEIGYQQEKNVIKLIIDYFPNAKVSIFKDYENQPRAIVIYE